MNGCFSNAMECIFAYLDHAYNHLYTRTRQARPEIRFRHVLRPEPWGLKWDNRPRSGYHDIVMTKPMGSECHPQQKLRLVLIAGQAPV